MDNTTEQVILPTIDETLAMWDTQEAFRAGSGLKNRPRWYMDSLEAIDRLREIVIVERRGSRRMCDMVKFLEPTGYSGSEENPAAVLVFAPQLRGAYETIQFLRSRGIEPASL